MVLAISALFIILCAGIAAFGYWMYARPAQLLEQIGAAAKQGGRPEPEETRAHGYKITKVLLWVGEKLPRSPEQSTATQRLLSMAGFRSDTAVTIYQGARMLSSLIAVFAAFTALRATELSQMLKIGGTIAAGMAAWMGSAIVLDTLIKRRRDRIRYALPDALDLLVVCVESGLGLDQAIAKVTAELAITHPDISQEFSLVSMEMRAGSDRAGALRNLATRTGEPELRKITALLIQTDRFGTSLAHSLRTHANFMRIRRRNEAEERAGKLGVKLTFPVFFFILPSIMIIAAGPGVLRLFKELMPAMRNAGG